MSQAEPLQESTEEKSFFQVIVHSFFIIPFLIAVFCAFLFGGMHLLTRENRTVYDYLKDIQTGGITKRWQGAFELSRILARPERVPTEQAFVTELVEAFQKARQDDPRVRQYLALAMGRSGNTAFTDPLIKALMADGDRPETRTAIIYALGMLKDPRATEALMPFVRHPDPRTRSLALAALGEIGPDTVSRDLFQRALTDPEPNVRWVAAVSLAKVGDAAGKPVLLKMLDRHYFEQFDEVDVQEATGLVLAAVEAGGALGDPDIRNQLQTLASSDPNMKVRAAAMKFLN